jgi:hypothetical protein
MSLFVTPDTATPSTLWRVVVGDEPETSVFQRASSTRIESGPFAEGTLTLQVQPIRIDWAYEPLGIEANAQPRVLGTFPSAAEPLIKLGHRWIESNSFPAAQRIAIGLILISATPDRASGYRELSEFIDGVPEASDATDFQYQINRPRPSAVDIEGLQLNRLSRWSVGAYKTVTLVSGGNPIQSPLVSHLRLELDINTNADFHGLLSPARAGDVIDDLFRGAKEISKQGNHF